ncbi:MAG: IS30 family transposase [Methylotenera sp.]|nr:IS30 family transposase [Methylotenera sp.]
MSYVHLTLAERHIIYHLKLYRLSVREIARRLHRSHTTISREMKRNAPAFPHWPYWGEGAHNQALTRRKQARHFKRQAHQPLLDYVIRGLQAQWSPDVIAAKLALDYANDMRMRISIESIYRWVYRDAVAGGTLFKNLRRCHPKRRKQSRYASLRGLLPGRVSIHARPDEVALKQRFGDWEGDTVEGAKGTGYITTHVERKSRYLIAKKLINKTAMVTRLATCQAFRPVPKALRKTLTLDNGKEFAQFKAIAKQTGLSIYFADPYSAWQRGCNENTNGLLRLYFPKGMDFKLVTEKTLAEAVKKLNHRPRKCLNYQSPHEVFLKAKRGALAM